MRVNETAPPRIRVVVADDHPSIRENLRYLLDAERDFTVVAVASDGREALRKTREFRPDVLVVDHEMPLTDGLGVIAQLRHELPDLPIVMYTTETEICEIALRLGARACVAKDEPPATLLAAIRQATRTERADGGPPDASEGLDDEARRRPIQSAALADAIALGQVGVELQPIIEIGTGRVSRLEALARWRHPERGWVPPSRFIGLAETSGMITPLTLAIARAATAGLREVQHLDPQLRVNLNLSIATLFDQTFFDQLIAVLAAAETDAHRLGIEVTENVLMREPAVTAGALRRLRDLGMRIEIDDFGTGYSSLGRLIDLPIDAVKIDRRFVRAMTRDHRSEAVVRACIALSHDLALEVVAEGVEDAETLDLLRALGCDTAQGYFIGAPMAVREVPAWSRGWAARSGQRDAADGSATVGDEGQRAKVLVVDDEPAIVLMIRDVLEDAGFAVITAANGADALRAIEQAPPAVVLLDMQMPILDGPAFVHALEQRGLRVPIIVMTAGSSAARWAKELPVAGYLSKPFDIEGLLGIASRYARPN